MRIADAGEVETLIEQMAASIAPQIGENTALLGILRRGAPLAERLADRLEAINHRRPPVGRLKLKRYSDDLELLYERPKLDQETLDIDIAKRHLIVVDDVLYTGTSTLEAVCFLRHAGAARLQVAVLTARSGRMVPIHADFVGRRIDIGPDWVIDCDIPPYEDELGITLAHQQALQAADTDRR